MKLALYQGPSPAGDVDKAFDTLETTMRRAVDGGAAMVVFPELYLPGYNMSAQHHDYAQRIDGQWMKHLSALARDIGCALTLGFSERDGLTVYNSAVAIDKTGALLARHRKIQLFGETETALFARGGGYTTFFWNDLRVGILICYDVEFPEHVRAMRRMGVDLILVPTANMAPYEFVSKSIVPTRSYESGVAIAYANYCGSERDLDYVGLSLITAADGTVLEAAGESEEALLLVDFNDLPGDLSQMSTQMRDLRALRVPLVGDALRAKAS